jgi:hypothetical protein
MWLNRLDRHAAFELDTAERPGLSHNQVDLPPTPGIDDVEE